MWRRVCELLSRRCFTDASHIAPDTHGRPQVIWACTCGNLTETTAGELPCQAGLDCGIKQAGTNNQHLIQTEDRWCLAASCCLHHELLVFNFQS